VVDDAEVAGLRLEARADDTGGVVARVRGGVGEAGAHRQHGCSSSSDHDSSDR
jgi:hypothetical protein